jgi:hypothetical protein
MSDITLAVGEGARRMTYAELAKARGISLPAARRPTLRHHWPKQMGNDGLVRVSVPLSALVRLRKLAADDDPTSDTVSSANGPLSDTESDTTRALRALESAVEGLREQLTGANQRADRAEYRIGELQMALAAAQERITALLMDQRSAAPIAPQPAPEAPRRRWWRWRHRSY